MLIYMCQGQFLAFSSSSRQSQWRNSPQNKKFKCFKTFFVWLMHLYLALDFAIQVSENWMNLTCWIVIWENVLELPPGVALMVKSGILNIRIRIQFLFDETFSLYLGSILIIDIKWQTIWRLNKYNFVLHCIHLLFVLYITRFPYDWNVQAWGTFFFF